MSRKKKHPVTDEAPEQEEAHERASGEEEWREKYLRALAELDNYRKRMEREREASRAYALESLLRDLLPVLDALDAAVEAEGDAEAIREGVRIARQDLVRVLSEKGLEAIEAEGRAFDPRWHEAASVAPAGEDHPPGTVIEELRRGYRFRDRVLRASKVRIAMAPAEPQGAVEAAAPAGEAEEAPAGTSEEEAEDGCPPTITAARPAATSWPPSSPSPRTR